MCQVAAFILFLLFGRLRPKSAAQVPAATDRLECGDRVAAAGRRQRMAVVERIAVRLRASPAGSRTELRSRPALVTPPSNPAGLIASTVPRDWNAATRAALDRRHVLRRSPFQRDRRLGSRRKIDHCPLGAKGCRWS